MLVPELPKTHDGHLELFRDDETAVFQYGPTKAADAFESKLKPRAAESPRLRAKYVRGSLVSVYPPSLIGHGVLHRSRPIARLIVVSTWLGVYDADAQAEPYDTAAMSLGARASASESSLESSAAHYRPFLREGVQLVWVLAKGSAPLPSISMTSRSKKTDGRKRQRASSTK